MATDATGAPTPLGIPKYNTSADAPSGLGFNAAMDVMDTLIAARVNKPAGITTGDVPVWNGTTFVRPTGTASSSVFLRGDGAWQAVSGAPTGLVSPFAGTTAPSGWVLADGSTYDGTQATYLALWALIGTTYGGTGQSAFIVPDLRGRGAMGKNAGTFSALGLTGGAETRALGTGNAATSGTGANRLDVTSVNVLDPYIVLNYVIKL